MIKKIFQLLFLLYLSGYISALVPSPQTSISSRNIRRPKMSINAFTIAAISEIGSSIYAGHVPGAVVGAISLLSATFLKDAEPTQIIRAINVLSTPLVYLILAVRLVTLFPDSRYAEFPSDIASPAGCTRVAPTYSTSRSIMPPVFESNPTDVQEEVRKWINKQPRTKIIKDEPGYIHAQALSFTFGFPDNLGVKFIATKSGGTEVWLQGELRVGGSDLGVNRARVVALMEHLKSNCK